MALGYKAIMNNVKTKFITAADLMLQLSTAYQQGELKTYMQRVILAPKLLIKDLGFSSRLKLNTRSKGAILLCHL